jgi:hypothetical protein
MQHTQSKVLCTRFDSARALESQAVIVLTIFRQPSQAKLTILSVLASKLTVSSVRASPEHKIVISTTPYCS